MFAPIVFSETWSQLCPVWAGWDWLGQRTLPMGMCQCPLCDLWRQRARSSTLKTWRHHKFWACRPGYICTEQWWSQLFLISTYLSPGSTHITAPSHNYPKPLAFGKVGLGSVLSSPLLAAVWINSLLQTSVSQPLACCTLGKWTWFGNTYKIQILLVSDA